MLSDLFHDVMHRQGRTGRHQTHNKHTPGYALHTNWPFITTWLDVDSLLAIGVMMSVVWDLTCTFGLQYRFVPMKFVSVMDTYVF